MEQKAISIRPFIGAKDFDLSRRFYNDMGFEERIIDDGMSYFQTQGIGFYLQKYYAKEWVDNTMVFVEVENVEAYWNELQALNLTAKYEQVKIVPVRSYDWGKECFVHDPSGILWHFGTFSK